ncbi:MAG: MFS transporter [Elusimicrobiota bacterium]
MISFFKTPAFRQSRPVLLTTFTNKVGSIGLSLITILLVKKGVSTGEGTFVLGTLKGTMLIGTLAGGALTDRFSSRTLVLLALLMSATGLGLLPFQSSIWLILLFGMCAQFSEALMNVVQRILLMDLVDFSHQKESLGWMRMVNNFAQIFSFTIAALGSGLGLTPLMMFDASTSLTAFFVGRKILPRTPGTAVKGRGLGGDKSEGQAGRSAFFRCAVVLMGWSFFYELFLEGGAGRLEMLHPSQGLHRFSTMMILNTVLCAAFAVQATRLFTKSWRAITGGMMLTALGILIACWGMASQYWVFTGMLFTTLGELMIGAVAQYTLMRLTPGDRNAGFYYSMGVTLMQSGRILGASLAFPLLIHAVSLTPFTLVVLAALTLQLGVLWSLRGEIARLG